MNRFTRGDQGSGPTILDNISRAFSGLDDKLEKSVKDHLKNVYSTVGVGLFAGAVGTSAHLFTTMFKSSGWFVFISLGLMFALISTPHNAANLKKRLGYYLAFCFISGIGVGPLVQATLQIDPSIIMTAFLSSATIFACFTMAALWAESTKFLHLAGTLSSALLFLIFGSFFFSHIVMLYAGLAVACLFILYDTQLIAEKSRRGDDDYIWHALELYIDFVNLFKHILVLLANKKDDERRRQKNN